MAATSSTPVSPFSMATTPGAFLRFATSSPAVTPASNASSTPASGLIDTTGGLASAAAANSLLPPLAGAANNWALMLQVLKQYATAASPSTVGTLGLFAPPPDYSASPTIVGSPSATKKLPLDADGNIVCAVCQQSVIEVDWRSHIEHERQQLARAVDQLRDRQRRSATFDAESLLESSGAPPTRAKGHLELLRVRANQQKRARVKPALFAAAAAATTIDAPAVVASPPPRHTTADPSWCRTCERRAEYLVISVGLDEPRCMNCYRKYRQKVALPISITGSSSDDAASNFASSPRPIGSDHTSNDTVIGTAISIDDADEPTASKRPRLEASF